MVLVTFVSVLQILSSPNFQLGTIKPLHSQEISDILLSFAMILFQAAQMTTHDQLMSIFYQVELISTPFTVVDIDIQH